MITKHTLNKTAAEGKAVTFSIKAQGTNLKYEWWRNESILKEDDHYSNVSTPHLSITNAGIMHSGQYYCVVSNEGGRATSNHTQLVISESSVSVHVNTYSILVKCILDKKPWAFYYERPLYPRLIQSCKTYYVYGILCTSHLAECHVTSNKIIVYTKS